MLPLDSVCHHSTPNLLTVIVEKRMAAPAIRLMERFYPEMVENLLKYPFDPRGIDVQRYEKILIFLDRAGSTKKRQQALVAGIKRYLASHLSADLTCFC